ncbi:MAG TPA: DUF262 domain-containing protein [Baekduia sp.]|uniref:GmrSD restriction endonuclease domain-containing protein n=1 Tax=Baekduia sp. TaxID=2600305 RepID=UPI002D786A9A|nr:DUF262 domain-containing protein [Baekduia sp.]HET6506032.1 DUF262 domain-containing protein [Baekduia sp.]
MSEPIAIRRAIERLIDGTIRIPGFQRKFVWEPQRAALLMDSLYKRYPVGSLLLWRTQHRLLRENRLGVFELPPPDRDYPVDYVLDGQQRLTSLFSTFQRSLQPTDPDDDTWLPIFYDFAAQDDAQESRFVALRPEEVVEGQHFPLSVFFDAVAFSRATRSLSEGANEEIVKVQQRFLETLIPVETFENEDRAVVAIVFERVNRMGIELDVFQLLTAWTWSDEFDLQQRFAELASEFSDFGFEEIGDDSDLMLRCTAAVLKQDPRPAALVDMNGSDVRAAFDQVAESIRRAIDFVRTNFHVRHVKLLPYPALLVPLAAYFSERAGQPVSNADYEVLRRWFWRSCFSHRFSGNPQRNLRRDIVEAVRLRRGEPSDLDSIGGAPDSRFYVAHRFNIRTVASKTLILQMAHFHPRSFLSGELVALERVLSEPNRSEYHHCFPRARLLALGMPDSAINVLANIAMISRAENRTISDKLPSEYRSLMPDDAVAILDAAGIPETLFDDDYETFIGQRCQLLAERAELLVS